VVKSIAQSSSLHKTNSRWCSILKLVVKEIPKNDRKEWEISNSSKGGEYLEAWRERGRTDGNF
jgi:hypothetical protein